MTKNPFEKIQQNAILTASPEELTLMLYNGAIKFSNQAIIAIENNDVQIAHEKITRVQEIIMEFIASLNHKYSVANDMALMYDYMNKRLIEANIKKDINIVEEVIGYLREFRDVWKEAMDVAKTQNKEKQAL